MTTWIKLIAEAILDAILTGKKMGLPDLAQHELDKITKMVNEAAAQLLPLQFDALNIAVQLATQDIIKKIQSLPDVERCPKCFDVLRVHLKDSKRWTSCDKCGYISPTTDR